MSLQGPNKKKYPQEKKDKKRLTFCGSCCIIVVLAKVPVHISSKQERIHLIGISREPLVKRRE